MSKGGGAGLSTEDKEAISQSFKSGKVEGNTVNFYMDSDTTGTPAFSFDFPEEIFLDQLNTGPVENFSWSALAYPNSVNPNLEGKTVFVLAVKGDKPTNPTIKYSFVDMEKLVDTYTASDTSITINDYKVAVNISAAANNAITKKNDGLHVDISGKVDKVKNATAGNIPVFDSDGGLVDSGINFEKLYHSVRYGIRIKKSEPDPYARVEYIYDAVNFTPANMDFENDTFNFGSWSDVWFVKDIKPLMLKNDGTVDYYLYENDYSIKANGDDVTTPSTAADSDSDVANTEYEGNAMVQIPLIWVKRYEDDDYIYEIVSNVKWDKNYKAYAHTNASGNVQPYFYYSMFEGSGSSSSIRSLSGKTVSKSLTASQQIQGAGANGTGWYIHTWSQRELIRTLCVLLGKSTDTQSVFGTGRATASGGNDSSITTGTLMNKGMFWGSSSNTSAVKVFHIENFWGNQWDRTAGLILNYTDGYVYVKMTPEGEGYRTTDVTGMTKTTAIPATGEEKYIQSCKAAVEGADDFGVIPVGFTSGSASTYYCSGYWRRSGSAWPSGNIGYLDAGSGSAGAKALSGAFAFALHNAPSHVSWASGCGLSYIG